MSNHDTGAPWVYLDPPMACQQFGDEASMRAMLPRLQDVLGKSVPRIDQLLADQDVRGAHQLLYALKGNLPIFCVQSLCSQVAMVEQQSKTDSAAAVAAAFAPLRAQLQDLHNEVARYLALPPTAT